MKCDGLILDIDGTIWDTTEITATAWNDAVKQLNVLLPQKITADVLKKEFGKTMDEIAGDMFPSVSTEKRELLMKQCCINEQKNIAENNADITYPEVPEIINEISKKINIFVVSNCQKGYCELVMHKIGITECITDFECFGNTGKGKTDNIKLLVQRNGLKNPVYVGDTQGDSNACLLAGVPFIWASYGFGVADRYDAKISLFRDLLLILDI